MLFRSELLFNDLAMKPQGFFGITNVCMTAKKTRSESRNPVVAYFVGAFEEFGKVTWPTKEQAALLTGIVIAVSVVFGILFGVYDFGLTALYQFALEKLSS